MHFVQAKTVPKQIAIPTSYRVTMLSLKEVLTSGLLASKTVPEA